LEHEDFHYRPDFLFMDPAVVSCMLIQCTGKRRRQPNQNTCIFIRSHIHIHIYIHITIRSRGTGGAGTGTGFEHTEPGLHPRQRCRSLLQWQLALVSKSLAIPQVFSLSFLFTTNIYIHTQILT
jgi:hypothetical protein